MNRFKIATFNANSIRARIDIVLNWLNSETPDVLCIQETKVQDSQFPVERFRNVGWHCSFHGQKSYNGIAIISRREPDSVRSGLCDGEEIENEQARIISTEFSGIHIVNTYIPQGFEPATERFTYKLRWLARLKKYFEANYTPETPLIWTGDFNIAPEPEDVYDPVHLKGHTGFHPDEHAALENIRKWGFEDIFRRHDKEPGKFTFYDYRIKNVLEKNMGWRIDHIWATAPAAVRSLSCYIDLTPRTLEKPSDHAILIAEFDLP